ncbi:MAG: hypothetical protein RIS34_1440 [Pseudomonadota bacterium]
MKYLSLLVSTLVCAPGFAPGLALAQTPPTPPTSPIVASVMEPTTPVPTLVYRSVFATTPTGVATESLDWKTANAVVGQFKNGYRDILKWEESEDGQKAGAGAPIESVRQKP